MVGLRRSWDVVRQSVRRVYRSEIIKTLQTALDSIRSQINMIMLSLIRSHQASADEKNKGMHDAEMLALKSAETTLLSAIEQHVQETRSLKRAAVLINEDHLQAVRRYEATLDVLSTSLRLMMKEDAAAVTTQRILDSLVFPEIDARQSQIDKAHAETFQWIFEDKKTAFASWLRNGNGTFWMGGKASSGKQSIGSFVHTPISAAVRSTSGNDGDVAATGGSWNL